jgi:hypothetical protein
MLLLGAFVWLARVTAGNIGALPAFALSLSGEFIGLNGSSGGGAIAIPPSSLLPNASTPGQQEVLSTLVLVGVMLGYLLWRVRKMVPRDEGSNTGFIAFLLLALGSFLALLISGRGIAELLLSLAQPRAGGSALISPAFTTLIYTLGAGIAGVSLASLVLYLSGIRRRAPSYPDGDSDAIAREFTSVISGTVYSLRSGSDFRLAVLRCYKSLCEILQDGGASNAPELTAREFEAIALEKLAIKKDNIQRITELFEKARYSRDTVDEADARDAEASLLSLEREVRGRPTGPGVSGARL